MIPAQAVLDALCPMHARIDGTGRVLALGPTLAKLRADMPRVGTGLSDLFAFSRPKDILTVTDLLPHSGRRLRLRFAAPPHTAFKGVFVPLADGGILNLSLGISAPEAVRDHDLTAADFDPTDLTVEMLYLIEAKSAAMDAFHKLSGRLESARTEAEQKAATDALTGLPNRRAFDRVMARAVAAHAPFALMHVDLDFFKAVNDRHGHAAGDHVLQVAARRMQAELRAVDTVARVGGDEFVILLPGARPDTPLDAIAARLIAVVEQPVAWEGVTCTVSASIGVALHNGRMGTAEELQEAADAALYASKRAGRAQVSFAPAA